MKIIARFSLMLVALCCWSLTVKANEAVDILFVSAAHSNKAKVGLLHEAALNNRSAAWNIKQKKRQRPDRHGSSTKPI